MCNRIEITQILVTCLILVNPLVSTGILERSYDMDSSLKSVQNTVNTASQYLEHDPIAIYSNSEFRSTAESEGWPGSGTQSSPYVIDGLSITGSTEMHCITIENTNVFFEIKNCVLDNNLGTYGLWLHNIRNGIVSNNTITNTGAHDVERWGISAAGDSGANNCIFVNNTISNTQYPFDLYGDGNLIINNNLYDQSNGFWIMGNSNVITYNSVQDGGNGIWLHDAWNSSISYNHFYNNGEGIFMENCVGSLIITNQIIENNGFGINLDSGSNNNLITLNYFDWNRQAPTSSQANDDGFNNVFTKNYWTELTSPDVNGDGYVDSGYVIDGLTEKNVDLYPLTSTDQLSSQHFLSFPLIIQPNDGAILEGLAIIQWNPSFDSSGHPILYNLSYSLDEGTTWNQIASNISGTGYTWNTSSLPEGSKVWLKVSVTCTEGESIAFISAIPYLIRGIEPVSLLVLVFVLVSLIAAVSGGLIMWKYRTKISETIVSYIYGTGALANLKRGTAVNMDLLVAELECSQLDLPRTIKEALTQQMDSHSLVLRSGLLLIEKTPPPNARGQICGMELIGDTYFQCENCQRYVCTPHYVDLKIVGRTKCPNCSGVLISLPFSCPACQLDYTDTVDFSKDRCSLCSYTLPSQDKLIEERTHTIIPSVRQPISETDFEKKKTY